MGSEQSELRYYAARFVDGLIDMSNRRKALHDLIDEARDGDLATLGELVARYQHPLDFAFPPVNAGSSQDERTRRQQALIMEAHSHARWAHLERQHNANTAKRLGIDPARIDCAAGGGSMGAGDSIEMTRHWSEGTAFCRLNTFHIADQTIITFDEAKISDSGLEVIYKLRVLTPIAESEADLSVPL